MVAYIFSDLLRFDLSLLVGLRPAYPGPAQGLVCELHLRVWL